MKILFCDEDIVVCVKPYGVLSQSDEKQNESMVSLLENELSSTVFPVHRLDRTTEGLMVFARNKASAAELSHQITEHKLQKRYRALVHGILEESEGKFTDLLYFDRSKNKSFVVKKERSGVKKAELFYRTVSVGKYENYDISDVEVTLVTGRTHQIRVQFASRKHSLLGDRRYGASDNCDRIELFSTGLSFFHPKTCEPVCFDLKPDFAVYSASDQS